MSGSGRRRLATLALGLGLLGCGGRTGLEDAIVLDRARLSFHEAAMDWPTEDSGSSVVRRLPDAWSRSERMRARSGTYRLSFELDRAPAEAWSIFLPEVRMNVVVRANGVGIGDGGSIREPVARNWNRPLLMSVPGDLLRPGTNTVELDIHASESSEPRLGRVWIGPTRVLIEPYESAYRQQITVRYVGIGLLLLIALGTGVLAARGVAPSSALWMGATALLVAFGQLDAVVRDIPMSTREWQWVNTTAYLASLWCFAVGVHRITGVRAPRIEALIAGVAVAMSIATAVAGPSYFVAVARSVLGSSALLVSYTLIRALLSGKRAIRVAVGSFCIVLLGLGATGWLSLLPVLVAMFTGWMLLVYFRDVLDRTEALNAELDRRVRERETELSRSYERMVSLTEQRTLAAERERLTREMHDGLGGMLVSTLAMVETAEFRPPLVAAAIREVLDEMRLMLDALGPQDEDLGASLGRLRNRLSPRLERYGLVVRWQVVAGLADLAASPTTVHHVLRILQEGITNVIRHAGARTIAIRVAAERRSDRPGVALELEDDGRGMSSGAQASRRGLANMKRRAEEIGAVLELISGPAGTTIRLWAPLSPRTRPPDGRSGPPLPGHSAEA